MEKQALFNPGPVVRLSLGLVALSACLLLVADWMFDATPNPTVSERQARKLLGEHLAVQIAALLEAGDERTLGRTLLQVLARNADLRSIGVRKRDGVLVAERGDHSQHWISPDSMRSTLDHVRVPLFEGPEHWGDIELRFSPAGPQSLQEWITQPTFLLIASFSALGFLLFYAYLRRAMHLLDPSSAVPARVRSAFDTITDGLLLLNRDGVIVLANLAFRKLHRDADREWLGRKVSDLMWLRPALAHVGTTDAPWERALRDQAQVRDERLTIPQADAPPKEVLVGCSPITDAGGRMRGCLVTFDDVSEVVRTNEQLRETLAKLEQSRSRIEAQNEELHRLATRDPLTGCLNRRAFFEAASEPFGRARSGGRHLCCIMADIDHFKRFNDIYGHAVGDQVIQAVARNLTRNSREGDLVCRYGGEEFCLILPDTTLEAAVQIAERMRASIQADASAAVRTTRVNQITSSFGVSTVSKDIEIDELIDRADNALYASKEAGRNCVTAWQPAEPLADSI